MRLVLLMVVAVTTSSLHAQPPVPARSVAAPKAIFTPAPEYRQEWARRGLVGKGVVLITIEEQTGTVTRAEMQQSTATSYWMVLRSKPIHVGASTRNP